MKKEELEEIRDLLEEIKELNNCINLPTVNELQEVYNELYDIKELAEGINIPRAIAGGM
jgi:hypothetical protein